MHICLQEKNACKNIPVKIKAMKINTCFMQFFTQYTKDEVYVTKSNI